MQQLIGPRHAQTAKAIELLRALEVGQSVPVDLMSTTLGINCVDGIGRCTVNRAKRYVLRHHLINIQWDRSNQAWKRTNDVETSEMMRSDSMRVRRAAKTGQMRARTIDFTKLSEKERIDTQVTLLQLQLADMATNHDTRKKLPKHECLIDPERFLLSLRQV